MTHLLWSYQHKSPIFTYCNIDCTLSLEELLPEKYLPAEWLKIDLKTQDIIPEITNLCPECEKRWRKSFE